MSDVFLHLVNISITASWVVLAILLLRLIFKKAPAALHCCLWGIVGLRLLLPVSLESVFSLIPSAKPLPNDLTVTQTPAINSGFEAVNNAVNPVLQEHLTPAMGDSVNPMQVVMGVSANLWLVGVAAILLYGLVSYLRLRHKVRISLPLKDNIYYCDHIPSPFLLGFIRPRIYLPSDLSEEQWPFVVAHEQAHLRRWDHWWKLLGFILLAVYWFNPLLWLAYVLFCRDIEKACDQRVIRDMDAADRRRYSEALVACSTRQRTALSCPLAFGEVGVKTRVKSVLYYKKPAFWLVVATAVVSIVAAVCLLTDPLGTGDGLIHRIPHTEKEDSETTAVIQSESESENEINSNSKTETTSATTQTPFLDHDYVISFSSAVFDVDGDGKNEHCSIGVGTTSGRFSYTFYAREEGSEVTEYKQPIYTPEPMDVSFHIRKDGTVQLQGLTQNKEHRLYDIGFSNGYITLTEAVPMKAVSPMPLSELELAISQAFGLDQFELTAITIDIVDAPAPSDGILNVRGQYVNNGEEQQWTKTIPIPYSAFIYLYKKDHPYIVYNSTPSDWYPNVVTSLDPNMVGYIYNLIFE